MNIISNLCLGAFTYKLMNQEFNNPFMWSVLVRDDLIHLIENYDSINWFNVTIHSASELDYIITKNIYYLTVDNKFNIVYLHYVFSPECTSITTKGVNVYYNKIWEYIIEKYVTRVKRMLSLNEPPCFYLMHGKIFSNKDMHDVADACKMHNFKCIMAHNNAYGPAYDNNVIQVNSDNTYECAAQALNEFKVKYGDTK